ncbi:hypothetical protein PVAP13_6KG193330 [Panicum virgatum]|uniref:Uncharacterized protein n=1 Tax=Panicum virgatum TaxID=38727 RepID=A0A8T0RCT7_PANVG|nr:hypothetical protein PVAP13_6KG193330 [Panicum virgatum]
MPTLEAAAGACGERHSAPRWGFMVRAPVRWAGLRRAASRPRPPPSGGEPLAPALQLEIAKEVVSRLTSLVNFLEDRIPGLKAAASGVSGGAAQPLSKVAPSGRVPAKARRAVAANLSPVATLRPGGKVATPAAAAHCTVGQQVVTRHLGEGDAHATSGVHSKMPEANVGHEHHTGQESSSEDESLSSSSSSSSKEPLTPALLLEIAKELINGFTMAQEYRMLSTSEQSLIKFLEGRIPGLEAEVASEVCSGGETLSPSKVASSGQACLKAKARRVIVSILSRPENTLIRPGLSAPLVHPLSHQVGAPLVNPRSHQVAAPAAYVTVDQQVITRYSGEEDAYTSSGVDNKMPEANAIHEHHTGQELSSEDESLSSSSSSSSKEPLAPALLLEIAKDLINGLTMAQEKRMLSTDEHSLIKFLEDRIPGLEAEIASEVCGGGETLSPSKVASSHACLQAEARHVIATILSRPATTLFRPGLSASLVHPLFHQVAAPAAYVTIDQQVVTRFSGEEDAYATSDVHQCSRRRN